MLISLALCATLLNAIATAVTASAAAARENDEFFRASQAARVTLQQLLTETRRGWVDTQSTSTSLHLLTAAGAQPAHDRTYTYYPPTASPSTPSGEVRLITNDDATDPDYTLARIVSALNFSIQTGTDATGAPCVTDVTVTLTVTIGKNQICLCGSASPRRSLLQ
jgi:type II secretory pathway pseudopilin PulG